MYGALICSLYLTSVRELVHIERFPGSGQYVQAMINGDSTENPLLVFIMGGMGAPVTVSYEPQLRPLGKRFIVASMCFRGVLGINDTHAPRNITENFEDVEWFIDYMMTRFAKKTTYLSGISYGGDMSILYTEKYPENVEAVIAMSPFMDLIGHAQRLHDASLARIPRPLRNTLRLIGMDNFLGFTLAVYISSFFGMVTYNCVNRYPFCIPNQVMPWELYFSPYMYGFTNYLGLMNEITDSIRSMQMLHLFFRVPTYIARPFYMFIGEYDAWANSTYSRKLFEQVNASSKQLVVFNESAHFILKEETEKMCEQIFQILDFHTSCRSV